MKIEKNKKILSLFEITLLVLMLFSTSYLIGNSIGSEIRYPNQKKDSERNGINFLKNLFSIKQIQIVSAQNGNELCCIERNDGATCQPISLENSQECKTLAKTSCDKVKSCEVGCCIDSLGSCNYKTSRLECETINGKWEKGEACEISQCSKGCCLEGREVYFETQNDCNYRKNEITEKDSIEFINVENEIACFDLINNEKEGACITSEGFSNKCEYILKKECDKKENSQFFKDFLCSNEELEKTFRYDYESKTEKRCYKSDIYWYDNKGNKEEIFEECGLRSTCSSKKNKIQCVSTECKDENDKERKDGESWCVYDSYIGDGKDNVGSRHWKAYCDKGKIKYEGCNDFRNSLCSEIEIDIEGGETFSQSSCMPNEAATCIRITSDMGEEIANYTRTIECLSQGNCDEEQKEKIKSDIEEITLDKKEECQKNKHCMFQEIDVSENFNFELCVPKYPPGSDLRDKGVDDGMCSFVSQECEVTFRRKAGQNWKCENNCECLTPEFAEKMNNLCVSIGDCGSFINYVGGFGEGSLTSVDLNLRKIKNEDLVISENEEYENVGPEIEKILKNKIISSINKNSYKKFSEIPSKKQNVESQDSGRIAEAFGISPLDLYSTSERSNRIAGVMGSISGGTGVVAGLFFKGAVAVGEGFAVAGASGSTAIAIETAVNVFAGISAGSSMVGGLAAGISAGIMIVNALDRTGASATTTIVMTSLFGLAGGTAIASSTLMSLLGITATTNIWNPIGWASVGVMGVSTIVTTSLLLTELGEKTTATVSFQCLPWQAPEGGTDKTCGVCNENPLKPCTKYRCESLGQQCQFLSGSKGEQIDQNPLCLGREQTKDPLVILPVESENYLLKNKSENKISLLLPEEKKIREFDIMNFTLKTNRPAQCKYDFEGREVEYSNMEDNYPLELNSYSIEHTFRIETPSINDSIVRDGCLNVFVKCKDGQENPINSNLGETYGVEICLEKIPSLEPVSKITFLPESGSSIPFYTKEKDILMFLDKPAECKYSGNKEISYENMEGEFRCNTDSDKRDSIYGWMCSTKLKDLDSSNNDYYIKCKTSSEGNINNQDFKYVLKKGGSELKIDSMQIGIQIEGQGEIKVPSGKSILTGGILRAPISLEIETSGGISEGISRCSYKWVNNYVEFKKTNSAKHRQEGINLFEGNFEIPIRCEDSAGNLAEDTIKFTLGIDDISPKIVGAFKIGKKLWITTNEKSECYYDSKECLPLLRNNLSKMESGNGIAHSLFWEEGKTYFISCEDKWKNSLKEGCDFAIKPR